MTLPLPLELLYQHHLKTVNLLRYQNFLFDHVLAPIMEELVVRVEVIWGEAFFEKFRILFKDIVIAAMCLLLVVEISESF